MMVRYHIARRAEDCRELCQKTPEYFHSVTKQDDVAGGHGGVSSTLSDECFPHQAAMEVSS